MDLRLDRRAANQLRPVVISANWLTFAEGSALVEFGETRVLCAASVTDGVPAWMRGSGRGWVSAEYSMLPRADRVRTDRERATGQIDGRSHEISRLISRALRSIVDLSRLGERTVVVDCDVLQADGGTRTASITGAYVALAAAVEYLRKTGSVAEPDSILTGQVSAVSVGIVDGVPMLDLCYAEDARSAADINVILSAEGELVEVQGGAEKAPIGRSLFAELVDLAAEGCAQLAQLQQRALDSSR